MRPFVHRSWHQRVVFGPGRRRRIAGELANLGAERVLVLTGGSATATGREIARLAGERVTRIFEEVRQHVPEALAQRATEAAAATRADHLLSVGGGSATGLAKAVAVQLRIPIVAVPTTYAGSEMTPIWAVTGDRKRTGTDARALPVTVVYDPELTIDLPSRVSAASGMNAMAQAVASLLHEPHDPIAALFGEEAIRGLAASLPNVTSRPADLDGRSHVLYSAALAARALAATGTGLHHEIAHILGGRYRLVHADLHTVLLPHTTARMQRVAPEGFDRLRRALATADPAGKLFDLVETVGAPTRLTDIGLPTDAYALLIQDLPEHDGLDADDVRALLADAYAGQRPRG